MVMVRIKQTDEERKAKWNAYMREYYQKNKSDINKRFVAGGYLKRYFTKNKAVALTAKGGRCVVCGYAYDGNNAAAFDFHHKDGEQRDIVGGMSQRGRQQMLEELEKCVLVCANCHRLIHFGSVVLPSEGVV